MDMKYAYAASHIGKDMPSCPYNDVPITIAATTDNTKELDKSVVEHCF